MMKWIFPFPVSVPTKTIVLCPNLGKIFKIGELI